VFVFVVGTSLVVHSLNLSLITSFEPFHLCSQIVLWRCHNRDDGDYVCSSINVVCIRMHKQRLG